MAPPSSPSPPAGDTAARDTSVGPDSTPLLHTTRNVPQATFDDLLDCAADLADAPAATTTQTHPNATLGLLFYEPSTRTRLSFTTAMQRLGGDTIDIRDTDHASAAKGESLADTVRVLDGYADALVLRHPNQGAAAHAAAYASQPVINAGDGANQHPTQALTDLYTLRDALDGALGDATIGIMGDLKYGRTVHSLAYALSAYGAEQHFFSPTQLQLPDRVRRDLHDSTSTIREHDDLSPYLDRLDALYVTRIQRERFPTDHDYQAVAGEYTVTADLLADTDDLAVLHPLPRTDEIETAVDATPHAEYFPQSHNAVPVRMALLDRVLRDTPAGSSR